jgi:hypothetical protein
MTRPPVNLFAVPGQAQKKQEKTGKQAPWLAATPKINNQFRLPPNSRQVSGGYFNTANTASNTAVKLR